MERGHKVDRTCLWCGNIFSARPIKIKYGGGKYCSAKCRSDARVSLVEHTCVQCGKVFKVKLANDKRGQGKYCSRDCSYKAKIREVECVCQICSKPFILTPSEFRQSGGKYCSMVCYRKSMKGAGHPRWCGGTKKSRGSNWNQQRKLAFNRDGGICQHCGVSKTKGGRNNSVHHIKPYRHFVDEYGKQNAPIYANVLTNLITLCPSCHKLAEYGRIILQPKLL